MKKYFLLIILVLLLTGCNNRPIIQKNEIPNEQNKQVYQEIETKLTNTDVSEDSIKRIDEEIKRLQKKGQNFWYDQNRKITHRTPMYDLQTKTECKNNDVKSDGNCLTVGLLVNKNHVPPNFKIETCNTEDMCLITNPKFPKATVDKVKQNLVGFLGFDKDIYTIAGFGKDKDTYSVYRNDAELFSHKMYWPTDSVFAHTDMVLNSPAFTFYDLAEWKDENTPVVHLNIWYEGETYNEKYNVEQSTYLFSYKDSVGFVGESNNKKFIFFNGQKISQDFDELRTDACCMAVAYPFEIDENGILFLLTKRDGKYFFVEIDLKNYLK